MPVTRTSRTYDLKRHEFPDGSQRTVHHLAAQYTVKDEAPMRSHLHSARKTFLPESVHVSVVQGEVADVHVRGPVLKVNGEPGSLEGRQEWYGSSTWAKAVSPGADRPAPAWLVGIVNQARQEAVEDMNGPTPAKSTPEAVQADTEALAAAGVPVRADGYPEGWKKPGMFDRSPARSVVELRAVATRLGALAAELAGAVADVNLDESHETLTALADQLEATRDGVDAAVKDLGNVSPMVLASWLELTYGTEFARKYRKASRMVRDDL